MSTEWVPLSISTPPPAIARCAFQRSFIDTFPLKVFSSSTGAPIRPDSMRARASTTSPT